MCFLIPTHQTCIGYITRVRVEIDSVLVARQRGEWTIFVFEAKHGGSRIMSRQSHRESLSKLKLAYPCLGIRSKRIPSGFNIVPVYVRSWSDEDQVHYRIVQCEFLGQTGKPIHISIN